MLNKGGEYFEFKIRSMVNVFGTKGNKGKPNTKDLTDTGNEDMNSLKHFTLQPSSRGKGDRKMKNQE